MASVAANEGGRVYVARGQSYPALPIHFRAGARALLASGRMSSNKAFCLHVAVLLFAGFLAAVPGYGQATVTVNSNSTLSLQAGVTTDTFTEVTPSTFSATTYTYAPGGTNGSMTISNLTPVNGTTLGSFVSGSVSGQYSAPNASSGNYIAIGGSQPPAAMPLT